MKKYIFHINGMHCHGCVLMTESELKDSPGVISAKSSLETHTVEIVGDFGDKPEAEIAEELTKVLSGLGYSLSVEKRARNRNLSDFKIAVPIALGFAALFVILQKIGLVNFVNASAGVSLWTAFVIGIVASLSTCMAVVGGLVLSMSATFAREPIRSGDSPQGLRGDRIRPQALFHIGRLVAFFIFGGVIGAIGSAFTLNGSVASILGLVIGTVMLILGVNLLDVFHIAKRFQPSMPKFLSRRAFGVSKLNHALTPALVGIATFFLPCGFTQSMQIYTLSTGGFWKGGLTMFFFALGTLPILALVSFSSFSIRDNSKSGIFFKSAGLIVIMFAVFNIINSLAIVGIIPPIFNF